VLPWQKNMTSDPIDRFVKEQDDDIRRKLAKDWREAKLAELNYVGITVRSNGVSSNRSNIDIESRALWSQVHSQVLLAGRQSSFCRMSWAYGSPALY
jgi:hypothetical protein